MGMAEDGFAVWASEVVVRGEMAAAGGACAPSSATCAQLTD